jgi:hypothetical protein
MHGLVALKGRNWDWSRWIPDRPERSDKAEVSGSSPLRPTHLTKGSAAHDGANGRGRYRVLDP